MTDEITATADRMRIALAQAYAPRINDAESMRVCGGLIEGRSERELGLESVPIQVVYSAMLKFAEADAKARMTPLNTQAEDA